MKLALIADVHSNLPALESVLTDIKKRKIDTIWNLGDMTGYCPYPNGVIQRLKNFCAINIIGNYDTKVLRFLKQQKKWKKTKDKVKFFSFAWMCKHISQGNKKYMNTLAHQRIIEFDGVNFLLVHGSPVSSEEPLGPWTKKNRLSELAGRLKDDAVLCAHSHCYFARKVIGKWFINPGSVGRPFDTDNRASYAIIEIDKGNLKVKNIRVSYDIERLLEKMRQERFPERLCQSVVIGKSLDCIRDDRFTINKHPVILQALRLAENCNFEKRHAFQVRKIALLLFDELILLHKMNEKDRLLLEIACLLHDIGWLEGRCQHHKAAQDIIMNDRTLSLSTYERMKVALVCRYHRRSFPKNQHEYYSDLNIRDKRIVRLMSSLMRLADGLNRSHLSFIEDIICTVLSSRIHLDIQTLRRPCEQDIQAGKKKADLFEHVFRKKVCMYWSR